MERKLASIRRITNIQPIVFTNKDGVEETAESIVRAQIDGWNIVTQKSNFKDGDLCVYFEIDSILPRQPWSEFLVDVNRPEKPIRIKTIRLKGNIAQGLALPLTILPYDTDTSSVFPAFNYEEGQDVTELLGVTKYEPPEPNAQLAGIARGNFPEFLKKTDEDRIQNSFKVLQPHFKQPFVVTEKLDGSSFTAYFRDGEFGVCSRNLNLKETEGNAFWQLARKLDLLMKMEEISRSFGNFAIQGEMVGPGIQKNKLKLPEIDLYLFNVYSIDADRFLDYVNFQFHAQKALELKTVPVWEVFQDGLPFESVDEIVEYVTRKSVIAPDVQAEGGVFRPKTESYVDRFGRLSFKAINPLFLLKYEDA
jgi:RNA ligase (TIGR02306 family)